MPLLGNPKHNLSHNSPLLDLLWIHFRPHWAFSNSVVIFVDEDDNNEDNNHFCGSFYDADSNSRYIYDVETELR